MKKPSYIEFPVDYLDVRLYLHTEEVYLIDSIRHGMDDLFIGTVGHLRDGFFSPEVLEHVKHPSTDEDDGFPTKETTYSVVVDDTFEDTVYIKAFDPGNTEEIYKPWYFDTYELIPEVEEIAKTLLKAFEE